MKRAILSAVLLLTAADRHILAQAGPPTTPSGRLLFTFHNGFYINLHHFLYVLGRARNGTPDSQRPAVNRAPSDLEGFDKLTDQDRQTWEAAITYYRNGPSKQDILFDTNLVSITRTLANTGDSAPLTRTNLPESLREILDRAAPIYRKVWWDRHSQSNQVRMRELQDLLNRYGQRASEMITHIYQQKWPDAGFIVEVSAYSNWAGAYSVVGGPIVIASTDELTAGTRSLEIMFHEAIHQWDDTIIALLKQTEDRLGSDPPHNLSHALIFYTAGYVVSQMIPGHRPYAESMWAPPRNPPRSSRIGCALAAILAR